MSWPAVSGFPHTQRVSWQALKVWELEDQHRLRFLSLRLSEVAEVCGVAHFGMVWIRLKGSEELEAEPGALLDLWNRPAELPGVESCLFPYLDLKSLLGVATMLADTGRWPIRGPL